MDNLSCGYKRRMEAMAQATGHLETMVKRVLAKGIRADYLLMDSWFAFPALLATLGKHLPVICMGKDVPKIFYRHKGQWLTLGRLFAKLKKRRSKARILASVIVETKKEQKKNRYCPSPPQTPMAGHPLHQGRPCRRGNRSY